MLSYIYRRKPRVRVRILDVIATLPANVTLLYEGAPEPHEDIADYLPRGLTVKGRVIA